MTTNIETVFRIHPIRVPRLREKNATVDSAYGDRARQIAIQATFLPPPTDLGDATVAGIAEIVLADGSIRRAIVVRRRRPFIPHGKDPAPVNKECSRLFALLERTDGFDVIEVTQ